MQFSPHFEIVACYLEYEGKFVLLHRNEHKSQGGKWGLPAGKVEQGETTLQALIREIAEECSVVLIPQDVQFHKTIFVEHSGYQFIYHTFNAALPKNAEIVINNSEHQAFCWVTPQEALQLNLMDDSADTIRMYYEI